MKIVWMAYDRANYAGGPIINAIRLLPELKKRGHAVVALIACVGEEMAHPNVDKLRANGVDCRIIQYPRYTEDFVKWILQQIAEVNPDIFVPNISFQGCFAGKWVKKAGIPVVSTLRGQESFNVGMARYFCLGPEEWRISGLVAVSNSLIGKLKQYHGSEALLPHTVIPSGVKASRYRSNQDDSVLRIVYSGRLVQRIKRFEDVFNTFLEILKNNNNVECHIFGEGENNEKEKYQAIVKSKNLDKRMIFHGIYSEDDYKKKLSQCHVIVLLSESEGMPGALMDGMSVGLIPISYNFEGIEEIVQHGENGFIVSNRTTEVWGLVDGLIKGQFNRRKLSEKAIETISGNFTLEKAASQWERFLGLLVDDTESEKSRLKLPGKIKLPPSHEFLPGHKVRPSLKLRLYRTLKPLWSGK